jgi:hypothetical protein
MSTQQWWHGDQQGERNNVLPAQGYRRVQGNGGMVISRENAIMCCPVRAADEYRAMMEW